MVKDMVIYDRDPECETLQRYLDYGCRFLVVDSNPRCGASMFFEKFSLLQAYSDEEKNRSDVFHICLESSLLDLEEALLKADIFSASDLADRLDRDVAIVRKGFPRIGGEGYISCSNSACPRFNRNRNTQQPFRGKLAGTGVARFLWHGISVSGTI